MAQFSGSRGKSHERIPPHPDDVHILERIGFEKSEWDQLNWYIQLANTPLEHFSPGQRLTRNEEMIAIERTLIRTIMRTDGRPIHSDEEFDEIHATVRKNVLELVDTGGVTLGPFTTHVSVLFDHVAEWSGDKSKSFLPYHFAQLVKQFHSSVLRCPHCKKIFLSSRRNAYHCSRECQSRAAARKQRTRTKRNTRRKLNRSRTNTKPVSSSPKRKGR